MLCATLGGVVGQVSRPAAGVHSRQPDLGLRLCCSVKSGNRHAAAAYVVRCNRLEKAIKVRRGVFTQAWLSRRT